MWRVDCNTLQSDAPLRSLASDVTVQDAPNPLFSACFAAHCSLAAASARRSRARESTEVAEDAVWVYSRFALSGCAALQAAHEQQQTCIPRGRGPSGCPDGPPLCSCAWRSSSAHAACRFTCEAAKLSSSSYAFVESSPQHLTRPPLLLLIPCCLSLLFTQVRGRVRLRNREYAAAHVCCSVC